MNLLELNFMISLLKKEIKVFFGSLIGYLIIGIFLLVNNGWGLTTL